MEKIKQAVEKARQQQAAQRGSETPKGANDSDSIADGIKYSKTRVVAPDAAALRRNRVILGSDDSQAAAAYNMLRTQVEQRLSANNWNSLAITSSSAEQGKTLTAVNLSLALAREMHRTVLLVDLDLRNPSVHKTLNLPVTHGLVDYLNSDIPVGDILINPGIERLVILPAGQPVANSSELVSSPNMVRLVEELKSRYPSRIIIFDLPPLLSVDDALAFSPYVDTTILVIEDGATTREELTRAVEILDDVHLLGTVLNKSLESVPAYARV